MSNVITLGVYIRSEAATSVSPEDRDIAAEIRAGTFPKERLGPMFERIGFAEWFERVGLKIYKNGIVNGTGET